eukprot:CAMPEP_0202959566 /NCGR_PEP_ID=MMETSP1396-20130829/3749_1 /ASSEMBLY_ACC=CAM_ASM_000872 /TAXON_ID= /ORGANISM="Pseudokeronopsis sp., Strain Brazil" /LENGTH=48 /DNA_ID= /DNA_START= /DNA_END= /DNA_ORIENTATION=
MEQHHLPISASHAYLIGGDCDDGFDALGADVLGEDEDLVFDLEAAEVA